MKIHFNYRSVSPIRSINILPITGGSPVVMAAVNAAVAHRARVFTILGVVIELQYLCAIAVIPLVLSADTVYNGTRWSGSCFYSSTLIGATSSTR